MYLKPKGHSVTTDGWGIETHRDTYTCVHCQKICEVEPRSNPSDWTCHSCFLPVCPKCYGGECDHFEKKLARSEARNQMFKDMGLI